MESAKKDDNYYRQCRDDIADVVAGIFPADASLKILDIGCGAGFLAGRLSHMFKNAEVTGIELNEAAAREAGGKCREVITGDIQQIPLNTAGFRENTFDCIILADILEHLIDPWAVVKKIKKALKDDGKVVASLPNIGNYGVIYYLLHGKWEYRDEGIMDRTHLRFFTLDGIVKMFAEAGFSPENIGANFSAANEETISKLAECAASLGGDIRKFRDESQVFQYLLTLKKSGPDF